MELGISMFADLALNKETGTRKPAQERLQELLEEIKLADEVGLDVFGIGEHHRPDFAVSAPEIIIAAASVVTKNIKLGSAVTVLSSADPVRVYQNFATADLISNGRVEIVAGRGSFIESFPLFGYDLEDYDALFEEKLNLLLQINQQEEITWSGKFRAPLYKQKVLPRAKNNALDIWIAVGGTPQSVVRAARLGLPLMVAIIGGYPAQFNPLIRLYKDEYQKSGHDVHKMRIGVHSHTFIGEDSKQAADYLFPGYAAQMDAVGRDRGWTPYTRAQYDKGRSFEGALLVGDVSEVTEKIIYQCEMFGLTRFVAHMDIGGPEHKQLMKSIELFGTKVAPEVRKALKKSEPKS
ncbi:luciferase [Arachidicoccus ginsenosidimutans]|uniref:LLM class flavin-dependent oxidoreductase n=1 Tax=Arachidicoccus sp. BS20 TaxID=1850526 RepID=UPI0007F1242E|nr:LLM class flavin-dependent oxidoreductase [Arachidicoccus sp. BS20]ANI90130.1 luciferase [Arachidicoccus sp. BS20]